MKATIIFQHTYLFTVTIETLTDYTDIKWHVQIETTKWTASSIIISATLPELPIDVWVTSIQLSTAWNCRLYMGQIFKSELSKRKTEFKNLLSPLLNILSHMRTPLNLPYEKLWSELLHKMILDSWKSIAGFCF